jgi:hypothetical protein
MGMFDSFIGKWVCKCGHVNNSDDVQTKELDQSLSYYTEGDFIADKYKYINGVDVCNGCKRTMEVKIYLEDGYYKGDIKYEGEW